MKEKISIEPIIRVDFDDENFTYDDVAVKVSATDSSFSVSLKAELVTLSDEAARAIEKTLTLVFDEYLLDYLKCFPHTYNEIKQHFTES